jgi:protein involved in polysaccharide export with SLBB domain
VIVVTPSRSPLRTLTSRHRSRLALALLAALTACVPAVPRPAPVAPTRSPSSQWLIEPGDIVRVRNWGAPEQSGDLLVNDVGNVLIPSVGRVPIAGLQPDSLQRRIERAYLGRIDSTRVDVMLLRPIAVVGGVRAPGVQLADPSSSVLSLVARSGGPTRVGGDMRVYVLRAGESTREVSTADLVADVGVRSTDQLYVQDPPFIVRNEVLIRTLVEGLQLVGSIFTVYYLIRRG